MKIQRILEEQKQISLTIPVAQLEHGSPIKTEKLWMRKLAKSQSGKIDAAKMVKDLFKQPIKN